MDSFIAELNTLAKTCSFCECLRDSLIGDRIVLEIKNEQTTKKLLRMRDLTLNHSIDVCRSEEVTLGYKRFHFAQRWKKVSGYAIKSDEEKEIGVLRFQAVKEKAVFAKMFVNQ